MDKTLIGIYTDKTVGFLLKSELGVGGMWMGGAGGLLPGEVLGSFLIRSRFQSFLKLAVRDLRLLTAFKFWSYNKIYNLHQSSSAPKKDLSKEIHRIVEL